MRFVISTINLVKNAKQLCGRKSERNTLNGSISEGDAYKCFDGTVPEKENLRKAEIYWKNGENENDERPIVEIIANGDIGIVDIMKEINANTY